MYTADERAEIVTIQQAVIPQMTELNIPMSPHNYTVWYAYVAGNDEELNSVVDVMLKRGDEFIEETMDMLYSQFCSELKSEEIEELRKELHKLVTTMHRSVGEIAGDSSVLSETLVESAQQMEGAESVQELRDIISKVVNKTREFSEKSDELGYSFDAAQQEMENMRKILETLQDEVRRDELTGIPNRKAFDETLEKQLSLAKRQDRPFSVLVIDIDHFKKVNDTYGHLIGDEVLKFMARRIEGRLRTEDLVARFGGEEFMTILPETTAPNALILAEELCSYFSKTELVRKTEPKTIGKVTISIGAAQYKQGESAKELIARADSALYDAKSGGRNQVQMSE